MLPLVEHLKGQDTGLIGAALCFFLALFWVIFGFWKTLFILSFTLAGYYVGLHYFGDQEELKSLLDKIFPPGRFR